MRFLHAACWFVLLSTIIASAGEPPTLQDGRPRIKKLGTIDVDKVENAPILFRGKYSWGNQQGIEHLAEAIYEGTEEQFLRGWFPQR